MVYMGGAHLAKERNMSVFLIGLAYILDLLIGDPRSWPHPVRFMGSAIGLLSTAARKAFGSPWSLRLGGVVLTLLVVGGTWLLTWTFLAFIGYWSAALATAAGVALAYTTMATRSLYDETWRVAVALREGDLDRARLLLGMVVGRDTANLTPREVWRALVETLAENLSDGVIAPMFYLALGGPALGLAYKAVNTLDSMIGYKNDDYRYLGWAAARLDDAVNYIPARMTAVGIVAAAFLLRLNAGGAWRTWWTDGGKHTSPNAGRPEAALAGALGVRLGGAGTYGGQLVVKPTIGQERHPLSFESVRRSEQVLFLCSGLMILALLLIEVIF
jgi:adenosylcobinamide-phosphate synthase